MPNKHHLAQPKCGGQLQGEQRLGLEAVRAAVGRRPGLCNWPLRQACTVGKWAVLVGRCSPRGYLRLMLAAASTLQHMQSSCKAAAHAPNNLLHHPRLPNRTKAWPVKGEHGQAASIRQRLLNVPPGEGAASKRVDQHNGSAAAAAPAVVALRQECIGCVDRIPKQLASRAS